ncbi:ribosomal RNA large subunit methyltransferase A [Cutibacterium acnes JCM 18920]|nr:ribosomal RNA large subunit methyltransferase A [Cutibacterium acnes JCM 18920]
MPTTPQPRHREAGLRHHDTYPGRANADTAEMIAARQRVLGAGLFRDLDARLARFSPTVIASSK